MNQPYHGGYTVSKPCGLPLQTATAGTVVDLEYGGRVSSRQGLLRRDLLPDAITKSRPISGVKSKDAKKYPQNPNFLDIPNKATSRDAII